MPPGMIWEILIGSFGVAGAILLVGGYIYLRIQRDRQHFQLMQSALEKGITSMPGMVPGWLISFRQGTLALILGLGVACSGIALAATANNIEEIPTAAIQNMNQRGPLFNPPDDQSFPPPQRDMQRDDGPRQPPRPPQNPAMERWHRIQTQRLTGLLAICAGAILALLGLVRISFSKMERQYTLTTPPTL